MGLVQTKIEQLKNREFLDQVKLNKNHVLSYRGNHEKYFLYNKSIKPVFTKEAIKIELSKDAPGVRHDDLGAGMSNFNFEKKILEYNIQHLSEDHKNYITFLKNQNFQFDSSGNNSERKIKCKIFDNSIKSNKLVKQINFYNMYKTKNVESSVLSNFSKKEAGLSNSVSKKMKIKKSIYLDGQDYSVLISEKRESTLNGLGQDFASFNFDVPFDATKTNIIKTPFARRDFNMLSSKVSDKSKFLASTKIVYTTASAKENRELG